MLGAPATEGGDHRLVRASEHRPDRAAEPVAKNREVQADRVVRALGKSDGLGAAGKATILMRRCIQKNARPDGKVW